ncbi:MAG: ATP-binding protein [Solirubrobacteraceae bacterium]
MNLADPRAERSSPDTIGARAPWGRPLIAELLESIPDPLIGCDADAVVVYWSRAARDAYGYAADEAIGTPMFSLLATRMPRPLREIIEELTDLGRWQGTFVHRCRDGRELEVESRWVGRYDDAGNLVGSFAIERPRAGADAAAVEAEHERSASELARAERLESLGQLAGGVAHDFNNALAIIINYAAFVSSEIDRLRTAPTEAQRTALGSDLKEIQTAAQRAAALTHQLLAFSRQGVGAPVLLGLNDTIREIEDLLGRTVGDHIALITDLADDLHPIRADPGQLQQVLINLAANAHDAMPLGGTLTIDTGNVELEGEGLAAGKELARGIYVRLRVSDTGTGMDPQVLDRAFDPFFTTKPVGYGSGLGLSSVYGIVTRAGGHAQFYSRPGVGTTFVALLPAQVPAPASPPPDARAVAHVPQDKTILLVEDEPALRAVTRRILTGAGYRVVEAPDGEAALEAAAPELTIDVLLTDVVMPGLLGHQLAERLRLQRPSLRVLYMSGFSERLLGQTAHLGRVALIEKPFTAPILLEEVRAAIAEPRPRDL